MHQPRPRHDCASKYDVRGPARHAPFDLKMDCGQVLTRHCHWRRAHGHSGKGAAESEEKDESKAEGRKYEELDSSAVQICLVSVDNRERPMPKSALRCRCISLEIRD